LRPLEDELLVRADVARNFCDGRCHSPICS
jgi:hypothetical protein